MLIWMLVLLPMSINAYFMDWFWVSEPIKRNTEQKTSLDFDGTPLVQVPYEAKSADDKFIDQVQTLTNGKVSQLDTCQHKVVMKIKTSCSSMSEEDLAKLSVNLLNCQASVEGRQIFPCTEDMTIGECTKLMDADVWNSYHLMSNRARSVCYAARQQQFRASAEMTVDRLVSTAHKQLSTMHILKEGQERLSEITSNTLLAVSKGQEDLLLKQDELQHHHKGLQSFVASNIQQLVREKYFIAAGHKELVSMTEDVRQRLDAAQVQLNLHSTEHKTNHEEVMQDLLRIQKQTMEIWSQMDQSNQAIRSQQQETAERYKQYLENLAQINVTIEYLLKLVETTRAEIDHRLGWLSNLSGGAGDRIDRLICAGQHILFLLVGALAAVFINAPSTVRFILFFLVVINVSVILQMGAAAAMDVCSEAFLVFVIYLVSCTFYYLKSWGITFYNSQKSTEYLMPSGNRSIERFSSPQFTQTTLFTRIENTVLYFKVHFWNMLQQIVRKGKGLFFKDPASPVRSWNSSPPRTVTPDPNDWSDDEYDCVQDLSTNTYKEGVTHRLRSYRRSSVSPSISLRQHEIGSQYNVPPTPSSSTRSSTPVRPETPAQCGAICRTGQPCRNIVAPGCNTCRVHSLNSSFNRSTLH